MDPCDIVELERLQVPDERFEDGRLQTGSSPFGERVPDRLEESDASGLEIDEVVAVMHDPHRIRLGESNPEVVAERVVVRMVRGVDGRSHSTSLADSPGPWTDLERSGP